MLSLVPSLFDSALAVFTTAKFFGIIILATTATACYNNVSFTHFVMFNNLRVRVEYSRSFPLLYNSYSLGSKLCIIAFDLQSPVLLPCVVRDRH
ncbi:hypothetical protein M378DRAFT_163779 [Amanita muscaria Koide BX008]|uniref:Uncharacterized protein n=1 Tax=Amanita muscaria (strain Koide BX008) TaxID=946122 RepID=A0A0C2SLM6_AMAMK|nr:hypothetical protein M378DRAFT_163779 [Amanita muscaria Koide BX008]